MRLFLVATLRITLLNIAILSAVDGAPAWFVGSLVGAFVASLELRTS